MLGTGISTSACMFGDVKVLKKTKQNTHTHKKKRSSVVHLQNGGNCRCGNRLATGDFVRYDGNSQNQGGDGCVTKCEDTNELCGGTGSFYSYFYNRGKIPLRGSYNK